MRHRINRYLPDVIFSENNHSRLCINYLFKIHKPFISKETLLYLLFCMIYYL